MGTVEAPASVLAVGEPYYDSAGRLDGWEGSPLFTVAFVDQGRRKSADLWESLALAVARAASRFMQIDEHGNVVAFEDIGDTDDYTPNYVSDPHLSVRGVSLVVDTKGMLSRAMAEAMLRTLVEELQLLPFDTRISRDDDADWRGVHWQLPHAEALVDEDGLTTSGARAAGRPARPRFVVVAREVRCLLRDAVPDVVVEYLDADDGWTTSLADARRFERGPFGGAAEIADHLARSMLER